MAEQFVVGVFDDPVGLFPRQLAVDYPPLIAALSWWSAEQFSPPSVELYGWGQCNCHTRRRFSLSEYSQSCTYRSCRVSRSLCSVMLCIENEQVEKLNLKQILEDFAVLKAHRMPFRQVSRTQMTASNVALCTCVDAVSKNCAVSALL